MAGTSLADRDGRPPSYSPTMGLIYIFNLIVGTGALTLPAAIHNVGWILGSIFLVILAFMSYMTATFIIESMAAANAITKWKRSQRLKRSEISLRVDDGTRSTSSSSPDSMPPTATARKIVQISEPSDDAGQYWRIEDDETFDNINSVYEARAGPSSPPSATMDESEPLISDDISHEAEGLPPRRKTPRSRTTSVSRLGAPEGDDHQFYDISEIIEMGKMASLFFSKTGRIMFYLCITVYLYGDLAIYGAAVAKSIRDVSCSAVPNGGENSSSSSFRVNPSSNVSETDPCWEGSGLTRMDMYRVFLASFVAVTGPFTFFNLTKTKYLQIFTTVLRWLAFGIMVTLASIRLSKGIVASPPLANINGIPSMFGACVYSFMCHHSLPSIVTPISRKKHTSTLIALDYFSVLCFYFLLSFTGIFAFEDLQDLYTLNFRPEPGEPWYMMSIHYFLSLFPVFTLTTSFPIIAITLRNNLKSLFLTEGRTYSWWTRQCLFPLLALAPPVTVAFATNSLEFLVGITGSYAGAGIQYVVPAFLVFCSRRSTREMIGVGVRNHHSSWFHSTAWVVFVQLWAAACVVLVTWNHISSLVVSH